MSEKISAMDSAVSLDGTELVPIVKAGDNKKTTTQDIADLGGGGGAPSLTATQIAFGDGSNLMSSDPAFTHTPSGRINILKLTDGIYIDDGVTTPNVVGLFYAGAGEPIATYNIFTTKYSYGQGVLQISNVSTFDDASHTMRVGINTLTPTVTLEVVGQVLITGLIEYPNRTAALAGGLTAGRLYSLPISGDNKVICIV